MFLPWGKAPGSLRVNLADLNVATYGRILTKGRNPVVTQNSLLKDQTVFKFIQHTLESLYTCDMLLCVLVICKFNYKY